MKAQLDLSAREAISDRYLARIAQYPWDRIAEDLDAYGAAVLPGLLSVDECTAAAELRTDASLTPIPPAADQRAWGNGDYCYFRYPVPDFIGGLRTALYPHLAPIANAWNERMEIAERYPRTHQMYLRACHNAGQTLSTSMLFDHAVGQQCLLHQDVYGDLTFPLQVVILLSRPGKDFAGGEFVITEQRPRMQTRPEVIVLNQGDAVVLAVSNRPVTGTRGTYRVNLRHGFSKIQEGRQRALGIIFHDAAA